MAYGFARQSGGGLSIRSVPGQGTSVLLAMPQTSVDPQQEGVAGEQACTGGGELVLLVEDDGDVRRIVRQQLIDLGHPVIEAENSEQALTMIGQIPDIALLVSDMLMPGGLNGRQLATEVQRLRPDMHIVLISGYTDVRERECEQVFQKRLGRMAQGAHFLSHVLWSAWFAWSLGLVMAAALQVPLVPAETGTETLTAAPQPIPPLH